MFRIGDRVRLNLNFPYNKIQTDEGIIIGFYLTSKDKDIVARIEVSGYDYQGKIPLHHERYLSNIEKIVIDLMPIWKKINQIN